MKTARSPFSIRVIRAIRGWKMGCGSAALCCSWSRVAVCVALFWLFAGAPAFGGDKKKKDPSDELFKSDKVLELVIELGPKELDALRREPRKYVKATLKDGDKTYADVGMHLKGAAGSFRGIDDKPNVTINMDKYKDGQLFHGLDKFHLANSLQDPSFLSELVCGEMFRAANIPASRVAHAVVTINGKRRGLFYLKEGYDTIFLKRHFKSSNGNLYDGGFLRDIDQPLHLLSSKGDVKNHEDLKALLAAAREGDAGVRFKKLEKLLDLDRFVNYMVLQVICWDWDGYPMNRNNYRIYHDPDSNKLIFFPSGMDQMFQNPGGPAIPDFQGFVARRLMETPEGRKLYLARMEETMKTTFRPDLLTKRLDELQARLQPVLAKVDAGAARDFPNQVNRLKTGIQQRAKSIEEQLKRLKK
jgi:spore coat protein H